MKQVGSTGLRKCNRILGLDKMKTMVNTWSDVVVRRAPAIASIRTVRFRPLVNESEANKTVKYNKYEFNVKCLDLLAGKLLF